MDDEIKEDIEFLKKELEKYKAKGDQETVKKIERKLELLQGPLVYINKTRIIIGSDEDEI